MLRKWGLDRHEPPNRTILDLPKRENMFRIRPQRFVSNNLGRQEGRKFDLGVVSLPTLKYCRAPKSENAAFFIYYQFQTRLASRLLAIQSRSQPASQPVFPTLFQSSSTHTQRRSNVIRRIIIYCLFVASTLSTVLGSRGGRGGGGEGGNTSESLMQT